MAEKKIIAVMGATGAHVACALNPEMQTFDRWLARNKERIPLE